MTDAADGEGLTFPVLMGARIETLPPIKDVFVDLSPGLVVLYGRNGAGKSRVLSGLSAAVNGRSDSAGSSRFELQYQWRLPRRQVPSWWWALPGNPWNSRMLSAEPDPRSDYSAADWVEHVQQFEELSDELRTEGPQVASSVRWLATRYLACNLEFWLADDPKRIIKACEDIVDTGIFRLDTSSESKLLSCASANIDTPVLLSLWNEIVAELEAAKASGKHFTHHEISDALFDVAGSFDRFGSLGFGMISTTGAVFGRTVPWWYEDYFEVGIGGVRSGPCVVLEETPIDLNRETVEYVRRRLVEEDHRDESKGPGTRLEITYEVRQALAADPVQALITSTAGQGFSVDGRVPQILRDLSARATEVCGNLMEDSPIIECVLHELPTWSNQGVLDWTALDPTGAQVPVGHLSAAQTRWVTFAIRFALFADQHPLPLLILLDEPEAALHRRAERFLVSGLTALAEQHNATIVAATHSPAFFSADGARLVHVTRQRDGSTQLTEMTEDVHQSLRELGLDPADLLQHCRLVVLVEGEHELWILSELFGAELKACGAELFALRGLRNLKSHADAQLLFRFTNARILIVSDNENTDVINDMWDQMCSARDAGGDPLAVLKDFKRGAPREREFLGQFMAEAVFGEQRERFRFHAMTLPDIIEYLPVHDVARSAPTDVTWNELHDRHAKSAAGLNFKEWVKRDMGGDYGETTIRSAVAGLDEVHPDFVQLLERIRLLVRERR